MWVIIYLCIWFSSVSCLLFRSALHLSSYRLWGVWRGQQQSVYIYRTLWHQHGNLVVSPTRSEKITPRNSRLHDSPNPAGFHSLRTNFHYHLSKHGFSGRFVVGWYTAKFPGSDSWSTVVGFKSICKFPLLNHRQPRFCTLRGFVESQDNRYRCHAVYASEAGANYHVHR